MKKLIITLAAIGFLSAPAFASSELEGHCEAYAAENGSDASGCACLADTADASATAELLAVDGPEDIDALSDNAKGAIQACFPDA